LSNILRVLFPLLPFPNVCLTGQYIVKIDVLKDISEEWEIEK
jgi:hypothetical protein